MRIKEPFKQEVWETGRNGLQEEEASDLGNEETSRGHLFTSTLPH